jgi:hypothetical protein
MSEPRYPEITVQLTGTNGNAYAVLGQVRRALRKAELGDAVVKEFTDEATAGDYDHLLATCMNWVNVL